jgi:hypothetical protein
MHSAWKKVGERVRQREKGDELEGGTRGRAAGERDSVSLWNTKGMSGAYELMVTVWCMDRRAETLKAVENVEHDGETRPR